jgi:hypothetical protein
MKSNLLNSECCVTHSTSPSPSERAGVRLSRGLMRFYNLFGDNYEQIIDELNEQLVA